MAVIPNRRRVLMIVMPFADPTLPNLAVEQLASIARSAGEACDVLYGNLLLSPSVSSAMINSISAPGIFTPAYYGLDPEKIAMELAHDCLSYGCLRYPISEQLSWDLIETTTVDFLVGMEAAYQCLQGCLDKIFIDQYDIICFAVSFDTQKLPSATLARHLKAREPNLRVLFGGTGCDGPMGQALLEIFPEVDAILQGEADLTFIPALSALRNELPLSSVANFLYRQEDKICKNHECQPICRLDAVPWPDYSSFIQQRQASLYHQRDLILLFETSRGCWWGQKHRCSFCGIKTIESNYRVRSSNGALELIETLSKTYNPKILYATDAILNKDYLSSTLLELARRRQKQGIQTELFYEVRPDLSQSDIALLAAAGVRWVQPGIESFSSHVLRLINKGSIGLRQVEFLKWAKAYGINLIYGLMVGIPDETIADYSQILALIPALHHLPPPLDVNRVLFHRFSPYALNPIAYRITNIKPFETQRIIYRAPDELLLRLCYELDCTFGDQNEPLHRDLQKSLILAVSNWRADYSNKASLIMNVADDRIVIIRRSLDDPLRVWLLDDLESRIYCLCEHVQPIDWIVNESGASSEAVIEIINRLADDRLVAVDGSYCLSLAIPAIASAWHDAGLTDNAE